MVARISPDPAEVELGESLEEATMTLVDRIAQWPEQWRREGVAEGRREGAAEGRREGVAAQRALLRRIAAMRFGDAVGERVGTLLGDTEEWDRLASAGELIASAEGETELIDGVARVVRRSH